MLFAYFVGIVGLVVAALLSATMGHNYIFGEIDSTQLHPYVAFPVSVACLYIAYGVYLYALNSLFLYLPDTDYEELPYQKD